MRLESLATVHRSWGLPSDDQVRWLLRYGVEAAAMVGPWPIGAATVRFDVGTFDLNPTGECALTFRVHECGEVIDLVAWHAHTGKLASWRGTAFAIGQQAIFNPATYFGGGTLRVHRTPLEWLLADRDGIVIVKPELTYAYVRNLRRVSCADTAYLQQVKQWLEPPRPSVELFVEVQEELAV
jgi:hypothetical protein